MKKNIQVSSLVFVFLLGIQINFAQKRKKGFVQKPNVIIINVDDMGYGDLASYGNKLWDTPNIDRLVKTGVRMTDGYVTAPVCGPSRHGLILGMYQQRLGFQWNHDSRKLGDGSSPQVVPDSQKQINEAFSAAGYVTAMAGKYHMQGYPNTKFDHNYSITTTGAHYFPDATGKYAGVDDLDGKKSKPKKGWIPRMWGPEREGDEYLTDRVGRQCIEFMDENKEKPFFFYLAFNAVHSPFHAKKSHLPKVKHIKSEMMKLYAAMSISIDENVGKILDYLEKENLRENTIVVFLSDNGPANVVHLSLKDWWPKDSPYHLMGQRAGLSGYKGIFREAGIRVPYIISWPSQLPQNEVFEKSVSTLDIYPTLCAAADVKVPSETRLDGVNLLPWLRGDYQEDPHKALFWYANRMGAVRIGDWKLMLEDNKPYLFNLKNDIGETTNLVKKEPLKLKELYNAYIGFRNEMPPALNPGARPIDIPSPDVLGIPIIEGN
ncbi:sulfatase-like hydrolase/transferase [Polaribacter sp. Z014]|uniref:sulfatase-like hydrolase/transferase n=1 Tax=Polaribacter sp. Z014 TaxID=2927126 RepID=UPI0020227668|nr:sulfatase-like hydrolase/transferase [Polaribacter sp. Z014]MCL7762511.1 sulfatase-like hydrolase/transferase [Polaribacter sp. Z014]